MKKSIITLLLLGILLVSPLVLAQEQAQTYPGSDRFIDSVKLAFSGGDNKVRLALEIREKEVGSAINNIKNQREDKAIENLERAKQKLQIVQEKVSLETSEEIKTNVGKIMDKVSEEENLPDEFEDYLLEEAKTILIVVLTEKTFELCKELAKEDYTAMLQEEVCDPETAVEGLEEELKELKNLQEELFVKLMLDVRSCIDDPGTCNCEDVSDRSEKAKCEKMIALAVRCEYKDDQEACSQMASMRPPAESFVPDFLMDLFRKKESMIDYDIEKSDVPEECYNENNKPECEQYRHLKETSAKCWDAEGNWLEEECGGPEDKEPTMQESIPQCYDENDNFLEEKCGKITMVKNEGGLINYIIGKEIDGILGKFENKTVQDTIDVGEWTVDEGGLEVGEGGLEGDAGQMQAQNKTREIKEEMNQISDRIIDPTYGWGGGGETCCKKIISGKAKYKWDPEEVCVDPRTIRGEVVNNAFCIALGAAIDIEDDIITEGVPEECAEQGVYDKESCGEIMRKLRERYDLEREAEGVVTDGGGSVVDNTIVSGGGDDVVVSGNGDDGGSDVAGVDEGPGEPGVVDED